MTTVLVESSEKIRPEWVARFRGGSSGDDWKMDCLNLAVCQGAARVLWDSGLYKILQFVEGFNEHGPVKVAPTCIFGSQACANAVGACGARCARCTKNDVRSGIAKQPEKVEKRWWVKCEYIGCGHPRTRLNGSPPTKVEPSLPPTGDHHDRLGNAGSSVAPIPRKEWIAPIERTRLMPWGVMSKVYELPDRYGTARTKLERDNEMWRPRWR